MRLDIFMLETNAPGGQSESSSRIETYPGFPNGISGQETAARDYTQALKFGAQLLIAKSSTRNCCVVLDENGSIWLPTIGRQPVACAL